jgi:hypothetical protein
MWSMSLITPVVFMSIMCEISWECTLCSALVGPTRGQLSNSIFIFTAVGIINPLANFLFRKPGCCKMKWHTRVDQWVCAAMPSLNVVDFLASSSFIQWYQEIMEKSEQNSNSLMSCTPFPDFWAQHQWKLVNWFPTGEKPIFRTKLFIICNITMNWMTILVGFFHEN